MANSVLRTPPLNPLRVFEAVARHENLTKAAEELHITQSAVSRHIANLESYLNVQLFIRGRHGVRPTRAGKEYARDISQAFSTISTATKALARKQGAPTIRLRVYTTFAMHWLTPRMIAFNTLHPEVELALSISVSKVDFDHDDVDMAILFGDGNWLNTRSDLLLADVIEPVCTPEFLAQHLSKGEHPESLLGHRLLISRYRRDDWDEWLQMAGLSESTKETERMVLNNSVLVHQAAKNGLGLAMGQTTLLAQEIEAGRLVCPFNRPLHRPRGYYLLRPEHAAEDALSNVFRDWLLNTI